MTAERELAWGAIPGRRQLLAGADGDELVVAVDQAEVAADFARIAAAGLDSVRVFLTWGRFPTGPA